MSGNLWTDGLLKARLKVIKGRIHENKKKIARLTEFYYIIFGLSIYGILLCKN